MPKQKKSFRYKKPTGKLVDSIKNLYKCSECDGTWSSNLLPGGRQPDYYNRCPHCDLEK
jgi:DNA-directed RNA polymerase subunit RPC12/RpoP